MNVKLFIDLQSKIMDLNKDNIEEVKHEIIASDLLINDIGKKYFINMIFATLNSRPKIHKIIIEFIQYFLDDQLSSIFCKSLISQLMSTSSYPHKIALYWLLYQFVCNLNIFDLDNFNKPLSSENFTQMTAIYIWLAPEMQQKLPSICSSISSNVSLQNGVFQTFKRCFFDKYDQLINNNWEKYMSYRKGTKTPSPLLRIIQRDDIEKFTEYSRQETFNINTKILPNVFEPNNIIQNSPPIISVAAFYDSTKIFDFCKLNNADITLQDTRGRLIPQFAAAGGSFNILKNSTDISFNGVATVSVQFHRYDVFYWIVESIGISEEEIFECFFEAPCVNNIMILQYFIEKKNMNINTLNKYGSTLLHLAVVNDNSTIIRYLLSNGNINPNVKNMHGMTPLLLSIMRESIDATESLVDNPLVNLEETDEELNTPLILAVKESDEELVQILLNKDINVNAQNENKLTALHFAVIHNKIKIVELLISCQNININIEDNDGWTPLHYAAQFDFIEIIEILLTSPKLDKTIKNRSNKTAFDIALYENRTRLLPLLQ